MNIFSYSKVVIDKIVDDLRNEIAFVREMVVSNSTDVDRRFNAIDQMIEQKVAERIQTIEQERQQRLESTTPYFELLSEIDVEDESKTKLELDWNPAFIKELRAKGYVGKTETELIQQWIQQIALQVEKQGKV